MLKTQILFGYLCFSALFSSGYLKLLFGREMILEETIGCSGSETDNFPVGIRVLAVDNDPTCLKLLDGLLRKCQYQVTTTNQARTALKMLREKKHRFDLVISNVHIPDMDGFKLLELVGLELDLPVIMLSANSDPKLVMKGITHGACDYLVKPVRIVELRNIWQHVRRRKKFDSKSQNKSTTQDNDHQKSEGRQGLAQAGNADQNEKINRKRKDDEEEDEENGHEDEGQATQKKPRVVWSIELHRKFVAIVNQLGMEKAVPKRILDLMNVEGLTRENVANHLQKYRHFLKRISAEASQQANMLRALGRKGMGSPDGLGNFQTLPGSRRFPNIALSPYPPSGMLDRLNSPVGGSLRSLTSSALIQLSHAQNMRNPITALGKFQPVVSTTNQNASNLIQGFPSSLELDRLLQRCSGSETDNFPVDIRVLAVVDDPTCLKLLDSLIWKRQYQVTITNQARMALKMLRENRHGFDMVIINVHKPNMDGSKHVALESDLPVIMLSESSDLRLITHGACDYLVKPVRIGEVGQRKKFDSNSQNKSTTQDYDHQENEGGQGPAHAGNADQNEKINKKRKDEEEQGEENKHEHESPATQKMPGVVWSMELHSKFVAAVNQLGQEKATPKRILALMNVEGLTREKVANHLQKYILYMKRLNVASQQANMVGALGFPWFSLA